MEAIMKKLLSCFLFFFLLCSPAFTQDFEDQSTVIFQARKEGYPIYRIPSIVKSDGVLLAFAEGRQNREDHSRNDMVLKRSFDDGQSWEKLQIIHKDRSLVMVNPSPVVTDSGKIILFYETFPHKYHARAIGWMGVKMMDPGYNEGTTQRLLMRTSDDQGTTWSEATDLTRYARLENEQTINAGSPANGIQIQHGQFKGRIVMPLFLAWKFNDTERTFKSAVLYSDDNGVSWKRSEFVPLPTEDDACNENLVSEISGGRLVMNARSYNEFRRISVSEDGGASWSAFSPDTRLTGSPCNGGLLSFFTGESPTLFFTRNYSQGGFLTGRKNGTLFSSGDDGANWKMTPLVKGYFGYSQIVKLDDTTIGIAYEDFDRTSRWMVRFITVDVTADLN